MTAATASWAARTDVPFEPGSFRDPSGRVVDKDGRILRLLTERAAEEFVWLRDRGIIDALVRSRRLIPTQEVRPDSVGFDPARVARVLEHERVRLISYPYEWCFAGLQAAALLHLDLHLDLLEQDATLVDASAYNVQFDGARPVLIDVLSLRRYRDGELWQGHRQFCEQFLNPLLLQARRGIPFNAWYRGAMEGIRVEDLSALLTWREKLSWRTLIHIVLPVRLQGAAHSGWVKVSGAARQRRLPKASLVAMLRGLRAWIAHLTPGGASGGGWTAYADTHTYTSDEVVEKRRFVAEFAAACRPRLLLDVGCNTGEYAALALQAGAQAVIGLDADAATADAAFRRAAGAGLNFLPLVMDAADPTPARGWREMERRSLSQRASFDGVLALALAHHLAIARNVPLDEIVAWLTGLAPRGVIEFVPKSDPTVQKMLMLREDIFDEYSLDHFATSIARRARIVRHTTVSSTGRVLFWYER